DVGDRHPRVVGGHVEGPQPLFDLHARIVGGDEQGGDAGGVAVLTPGAAEAEDVVGVVHAAGPHLLAVDQPARLTVAVLAHGGRFHVGGVRAVVRLRPAER